jgi:hypothetical protein
MSFFHKKNKGSSCLSRLSTMSGINLNDNVWDHVFLDFILAYSKLSQTQVKFRKWEGPVNVAKVLKGNEIGSTQNYVFVTLRQYMDAETQNLVYERASQSTFNFTLRKYWNVAFIGHKFCVLNSNTRNSIERPLQQREFLLLMRIMMKSYSDPEVMRKDIQMEFGISNHCCTCMSSFNRVYACMKCNSAYCKDCILEMKGFSPSTTNEFDAECIVCDDTFRVIVEEDNALTFQVCTSNLMFLKEGALYFMLKNVEGIPIDNAVVLPAYNRQRFVDEIIDKVPEAILRKYMALPPRVSNATALPAAI